MLEDILSRTYSANDCAVALQHGALSEFRRNLTRNNLLFLPRRAKTGPGGGEYRYAHIVEMAIHSILAGARGGPIAKSVVWGLSRYLWEKAIPEFNGLEIERPRSDPGDFPAGTPLEISAIVDLPAIHFGSDKISRTLSMPTFLVFAPRGDGAPADVLMAPDQSLASTQAALIETLVARATPTYAAIAEENCDLISAINLTTMLNRIDERLETLIKAREIRGA